MATNQDLIRKEAKRAAALKRANRSLILKRKEKKRAAALKKANQETYEVAQYLKRVRLNLNITQEAVAEEMGVFRPSVTRLESGYYAMTLRQLFLYADALVKLGGQDVLMELRDKVRESAA